MKTFKGKEISLSASELKIDEIAPNFKCLNKSFKEIFLNDFENKYILINVVLSLDTTICDIQTKTIYEEISKLEDLDIKIITISADLPFAQERWKSNNELDDLVVLSDFFYHDFGNKFGVLINELKLLLRSFFILDKNKKIIYVDYADEVNQHLDYEKLINTINNEILQKKWY